MALGDAAHDVAIGLLQDAVTTGNGGQRADRVQRTRQSAQVQGLALQALGEQGLWSAAQGVEACAGLLQAPPRMAGAQDRVGTSKR